MTGPAPYSSFPVFKTSYHVIIHHPRSLHVRVADRGADELEAALLQVFGQGVGLRRGRPDGFSSQSIGIAHCPVSREAPDVPIETAVLLLHVEKPPRVSNGRFDFQAIANDARVSHQARDVGLAESRHFPHVEVFERLPEIVALAQDGNPAQPRLEALQCQQLEDLPIFMDRHAPLLVVILTVQRVLPAPPAPWLTGSAPHTGHDSSFHAISQNIHSYRELMMNACSMRAFSPSLAFFAHASTRPRIHRPTSANSGEA